jgi:pyridoxine 4-dehydrogenase
MTTQMLEFSPKPEPTSSLSSLQIDHVALNVPNYEETLAWYRDKLDATIEREWTVGIFPDLKLAYLNVYGFRIEIVSNTQSRSGMPETNDFGEGLRTSGIGHFCFRVDDVDAVLAELNQRGVPAFVELGSYPDAGVRLCFVKDNNGNLIEFVTPLKKPSTVISNGNLWRTSIMLYESNPLAIANTFQLGGDQRVNRLGYGAMRLTGQPSNFGRYPDWETGQQLLRRAVSLGVNFIDTAEAYGPGYNEELIASALYPYPPDLLIATKGGVLKTSPDNIRADGSPTSLRRSCENSLQRLKVEQIGLYQLHRPDPNVPFSESIGMLAELQREGKIRHIGLSNVTLAQLETARQTAEIASVQNRLNLTERIGEDVLYYCTQHHIAFISYAPLGAHPLKHGAPLANAEGTLSEIADRQGVKPSQIALSWMLHHAPNMILIPGTTTIAHLEENIAAASIALTADDIKILNQS